MSTLDVLPTLLQKVRGDGEMREANGSLPEGAQAVERRSGEIKIHSDCSTKAGSTTSAAEEVDVELGECETNAAMDYKDMDSQRSDSSWYESLGISRLWGDSRSIKSVPSSRFGTAATLPEFDPREHVPVLALINTKSGGGSGPDILEAACNTPYYRENFFDIIDVVRGKGPGELLDTFRSALNRAKEQAKHMNARPRLISGGGDGTGSFALFIVFSALKADETRPEPELRDTGNGFTWTDAELRDYFPALAQMPLGSANDFAHTLGWGQKCPGKGSFAGQGSALEQLRRWVSAVIDPKTRLANFDMYGIMPRPGASATDFKVCELAGERGFDPKEQGPDGQSELRMKEAATPVPFFVCLYFSAGFAAYMVARFQINRRDGPLRNKMEYCRQALGITCERTPRQLENRLNKVKVACEGAHYFPPGQSGSGQSYRDVGFFNVNWQANMLHGAERAPVCTRLTSVREPASFNDGHVDMFRMKLRSVLKNPGTRVQTDKKKDMNLNFEGGKGEGVFFQWDGEARYAFSPTGEPFSIHVRKVVGDPDNGKKVLFEFAGETPEARHAVQARLLQCVEGLLEGEMNATEEELIAAGLAARC
mmetsp:Transcript_89083/g.229892  ORF Transcript_89083/g.229892 Transcript_89083/m.229892 type:complete len:595 (+) Transcript_89083:125-1909(+)|eukprot:CAMPEP_0195068862 /NCGR_PEP_ID=MMETSP0448-20130528/13384_1 /TAXON_ID=66468 /ORGANISM="Heterocapsa triquestra, Strain CCMP 448" /LENGTH=594 /DNA_ID=CAMNT_0040100407 /DNA_START=122 /DNA_END=1906 /DNA_ORIENTATION=+